MKTKFIALSLIVAGICIASCRQDDENPAEETIQSSLKQDSTEELQKNGNDSMVVENSETDPPRDGAHWKVDEIKTENVKVDSTLLPKFNLDNSTDPPRDGAHWKGKEN